MLAGVPHQGGATWALLQYVLGLRRLGHDVMVLDVVPAPPRPDVMQYFRSVVDEHSLQGRAALMVSGTRNSVGLEFDEVVDFARRTEVLLNASGVLRDHRVTEAIPTRVYLDLDPAFTQLWQSVEGIDMGLEGHTHFVTVGLQIGGDSSIPDCGRRWIPSLAPVVLEHWSRADEVEYDALTTVANWRGYGSVRHADVLYGQKAHSLRALIDLPRRTDEKLLLALDIHPDERPDLDALATYGWARIDPRVAAGTTASYHDFVRGSKAEFGLAKSGYVVSSSGWFSDRSACYLASGRPVIAQDTGFASRLPTGEGLFAFCAYDDVLAAIKAINGDYARHATAARSLATEYFDSDRVLTTLLDRVG